MIVSMFRLFLALSLILFSMAFASGATILLLKDGGTLEGELLNPDEINRKLYRIKTADGLAISIDAKLVERQQGREREALVEYNREAPLTPNTVENHLNWAKWCNERQLPEQAKTHWQQVLELDPDHGDARRVLGYVSTANGWESQRDRQENKGLLEYRGRWKTPYQIEVERILDSQKAETNHWKKTVNELYRRLPNPQAEAELLAIRHPGAVAPIKELLLKELLLKENRPQRRIMLLRLLMQIPDGYAIQFVIGWSIRPDEPIEDIRKMCVEELLRQINNRPEIRPTMIAVYRDALKPSRHPAIINLAAKVLGDIGGDEAVPELIDVLVATKTETSQLAAPTYSFGSGGTGYGQQGKPISRQIQVENQTVLSALCKLTGVNFGFNQADWWQWHRQSQRSPSLNLRRD
jgi:hypothetical protein